MCLFDKKQYRIAKKDIKVWKIVTKDNKSPYAKTQLFQTNSTSSGEPEYMEYASFITSKHKKPWHPYRFGEGFFHAYLTKKYAEEQFKRNKECLLNLINNDCKIVKGYIPAGTRYALQCEMPNKSDNGEVCSRVLILNL